MKTKCETLAKSIYSHLVYYDKEHIILSPALYTISYKGFYFNPIQKNNDRKYFSR